MIAQLAKKLVGPLGEELQARGVAAGDFEDAPACVADLVERFHRRRPVVVAFAEFDLKAFAQAFGVALFAAEFLDVQIEDARAEDAHPMLRPAVGHEIAEIEMPADPRAADLIDETRGARAGP